MRGWDAATNAAPPKIFDRTSLRPEFSETVISKLLDDLHGCNLDGEKACAEERVKARKMDRFMFVIICGCF